MIRSRSGGVGVAIVVSLCIGLFAAGPAIAAGERPALSIVKVAEPPQKIVAGFRFTTSGAVSNGGAVRARKARFIVRLRSLSGKQRRIRRATLGAIAPGARRSFALPVRVPSGLQPGDYRLQVCVSRRGRRGRLICEVAAGKLAVLAPQAVPVGPTPATPGATPDDPDAEVPGPPATPTPGARSAGDVLFPEIGNGGYEALNYEIALAYDPATNLFGAGTTTTMTARATKALSEFSLDFEGLTVITVTVGGQPASFTRVVPAACSPSGAVTTCGPTKLVVTPPVAIPSGSQFAVEVAYTGEPQRHQDPDGSFEGWFRACRTAGNPPTNCDGSFVVNEPVGAMTWFPQNNHPADKATIETLITVPTVTGVKAIGVGELISSAPNGNGTTTWHWSEDDPTATYLTTATVGQFDLKQTTMTEVSSGQTLPVYYFIDSSYDRLQKAQIQLGLDETPDIMNFFSDSYYGTYPFDSTGAIVDRTTGVGYALEVQTKPAYATSTVLRPTVVHELAHQWFGNNATLATWSDIWFNEGWAQWSDWYHTTPNTPLGPAPPTPEVAESNFQTEYNDGDEEKWQIAPAVLDGDPANLFELFPTYTRGAMTLEGYRQIVGDANYFEFARALQTEYRFGNIGTREVIALALRESGITDQVQRDMLSDYFEQWLYGEVRPTITPDSF